MICYLKIAIMKSRELKTIVRHAQSVTRMTEIGGCGGHWALAYGLGRRLCNNAKGIGYFYEHS